MKRNNLKPLEIVLRAHSKFRNIHSSKFSKSQSKQQKPVTSEAQRPSPIPLPPAYPQLYLMETTPGILIQDAAAKKMSSLSYLRSQFGL